MEDSHIIRLLFARSEEAIAALARRFGPRLHTMALNILRSSRDAEECVNDSYLAVWNAIPPEQPQPLAPYVYRVGRNTALKRLRANTAQKRDNGYDLSLEELEGCIPDHSAEGILDAQLLGEAINRFLDKQSKENRVIFLRRYWYGDSVPDIAEALHLRPGTVSTRLNRLRNALKQHLLQEGIYL